VLFVADQISPSDVWDGTIDRLNRPGEVCDRFNISRTTLGALIAAGELDVVYIGAHRRITESSIQQYMERHRRS
jgi:excisionase family DNA binding protein